MLINQLSRTGNFEGCHVVPTREETLVMLGFQGTFRSRKIFMYLTHSNIQALSTDVLKKSVFAVTICANR